MDFAEFLEPIAGDSVDHRVRLRSVTVHCCGGFDGSALKS